MRRSAALALLLLAFAAPAHAAPTRYSLANGCYAVNGLPGAEQVRMQAADLGAYLLYRPDGTYVTPQGVSAQPAIWTVHKKTISSGGVTKAVTFTPASGCAVFPEADLDATGTPSKGATPYGKVGGLVDGHMHWMTYEYLGGNFHCGAPWSPYGIAAALPDCASIEGPGGTAAPFQNFLNYGNPAQPHDTRGYPFLTEWKATNLTYEGTYWRWIERAWMAGLRLMVMSVNENRVLCSLQANRRTDCDEMEAVRRGFDDIEALQRYVDAQAGGPGKGFFQIVTDPYQARKVINAGKMAVVLEIEVSEPFGCRGGDQSTCNQAQVDEQIDELYRRGVRSMLLLNKFDNPLSGVRFDSGPTGVLINGANVLSAGSFWSAKTCTGPLHDNTIQTSTPVQTPGLPIVTTPVYPPPPHCNTRGLTALGAHTVERMMDRHMIVNPDHMSQAGVDATLSLLEQRHYSGVISPHGWMDPGNWPRIWKLGGVAWPGHSSAADYVKVWQQYRPQSTPYAFGWGYGADLGGLSVQPGAGALPYPFKSLDGKVTFQRQTTGQRTFDYDSEGVAHYGLYADWFADLKRLGGRQLADDLWNGAEAYLEMWERADGIKSADCRTKLRLGWSWKTLLKRAGQPQQRTRAWSYCNHVAVLGANGRVVLVGKRVVRGGRVHVVARTHLRGRALRTALRRVRNAKAKPRPAFAARTTSLTGRTLAGTGIPGTDAGLALLCSLLA
jgi:microsomal dipeptidase-like Zn-dependent dipeptidase